MRRVLVAGLGNELRGDDGFGVVVARRLRQGALPDGVVVRELGLRSFDLALALLDVDAAVLVDAAARGGTPGALYVIEVEAGASSRRLLDAHALHPGAVLDLVRGLGGVPPPLTVVGCEPGDLASEEEPSLELSPAVAAAVDPAVELVRGLVETALETPRNGAPAHA